MKTSDSPRRANRAGFSVNRMNLGRSFEHRRHPEIPHPFSVRLCRDVSGTAGNLKGVVQGLPGPGGSEQLAVGAFQSHVCRRFLPEDGGREIHHGRGDECLYAGLDDLFLNEFEMVDGHPELLPGGSSAAHVRGRLLHHAGRSCGQGEPAVVQDRHGDPEAVARATQEIPGRDTDIPKADGGGGTCREAELRHVPADLHPLPAALHHECAHEAGPGRVELGEDREGAGIIGVCNVGLVAVEDIEGLIPGEVGPSLDIPGVRAGFGLSQGIGEDHGARSCGER